MRSISKTRIFLKPKPFFTRNTFFLSYVFTYPKNHLFKTHYSKLTNAQLERALREIKALPKEDFLKKYCIDLSILAKEGKLDPVIGRDSEIRRTIQVLSRRTKNNPVFIGEPGVGKTALVEGLAQAIYKGDVPESIKGTKVLTLDLPSIISGACHQGDFEKRFRGVIDAIEKSEGRIILFCDELHMLVGAGQTNTMDAANMLKPALARGSIRFVGATTLNEYRMHIEKDGALARRFQPIILNEPTVDDAIAVLRGIKHKYEIHHGVKIMDSAVVASSKYAKRYLTERKLPDSAIDLLDESCSRLRLRQDSKPSEVEHMDKEILTLKIEQEALKRDSGFAASASKRKDNQKRLNQISELLKEKSLVSDRLNKEWQKSKARRLEAKNNKAKLDQAETELNQATSDGNFNLAGKIKYETIPKLKEKMKDLSKDVDPSLEPVTEDEVSNVVALSTGIPIAKLLMTEREKLLNMEQVLEKRVIGQNKAVKAVSDCVRISRAGLNPHTKPLGCFLFLGPTGVGKTELAKALAEFLFDNENAMMRVDMSEYMERHSVSKLIGSPPGYVGYEEGGRLTEMVRRRPFQVVLFDEIEKAHREVTNILLQLLDEGHLTDSQGRKVDFKNTIVIMTSNLGAVNMIDENTSRSIIKYNAETALEAVHKHFSPEFLNRLDEIIKFNQLEIKDMKPIAQIQIKKVKELLLEKSMTFRITDNGLNWIAKKGFDSNFGARPLKRVIQNYLLNALSQYILSNDIVEGSEVVCDLNDLKDELKFNYFEPEKNEKNSS